MSKTLRIGTRGSALALWQANHVAHQLESLHEGLKTELVIYKTMGDHILDRPLAEIGGKGLFTKELEVALLDGDIHLAVHSLKDMPTALPEGLILGAIPVRADVRDCLLTRRTDAHQPRIIGTASLRRGALAHRRLQDPTIRSIRGNVETRMNRLFAEDESRCDGVLLAMAGLIRLELNTTRTDVAFLPLNPEHFIPAVGQGALAIECAANDDWTRGLLKAIHHDATARCVQAERRFLAGVEGSCRVPVGGYATCDRENIRLKAFVANPDGSLYLEEIIMGTQPEAVGQQAADRLLERGAGDILKSLLGE